jgi:hypothetical protein
MAGILKKFFGLYRYTEKRFFGIGSNLGHLETCRLGLAYPEHRHLKPYTQKRNKNRIKVKDPSMSIFTTPVLGSAP